MFKHSGVIDNLGADGSTEGMRGTIFGWGKSEGRKLAQKANANRAAIRHRHGQSGLLSTPPLSVQFIANPAYNTDRGNLSAN